MRFQASVYLRDQVWPSNQCPDRANCPPLDNSEIAILQQKLKTDINSSFYSSMVTFSEAINSLRNGYYSWSGVKLYYAAFYAIRGILAKNGICIFHFGRKSQWVKITDYLTPQNPPNGANNTHKIGFALFRRFFTNHILCSQEIDGQPPFEWLMEQREFLNYKTAKFPDPLRPACFNDGIESQLDHFLQTYISDSEYQYTFDPDHALIALPIAVLKHIKEIPICSNGSFFEDADLNNLDNYLYPTQDNNDLFGCFLRP